LGSAPRRWFLGRFRRGIELCGDWCPLGPPLFLLGLGHAAELEPEIPDPLSENLPELLPTGVVRTPAIGVLFPIFIRQDRLERAALMIQGDDILRQESPRGQRGQKQFVDVLP
jgi:hypothetical protein